MKLYEQLNLLVTTDLDKHEKQLIFTLALTGERYFKSRETLLDELSWGKNLLYKTLQSLVAKNLVTVEDRHRSSTIYRVNWSEMPLESPVRHVEPQINTSAPEPPEEFIEASEAVTEPRSKNQIHRLNEFVEDGIDELTAKQIGEQWADEAIEREKEDKRKRQEWQQRVHEGVQNKPTEPDTPPTRQKLFSDLPDIWTKRDAETKKGGDEWEAFFSEHPDLRPEEAVAK